MTPKRRKARKALAAVPIDAVFGRPKTPRRIKSRRIRRWCQRVRKRLGPSWRLLVKCNRSTARWGYSRVFDLSKEGIACTWHQPPK